MSIIAIDPKRCTRCGSTKKISEFYRKYSGADGYASECKSCTKERVVIWQKKNPEKTNKRTREYQRKKIGCSPEKYAEMYEAQGGSCGICGVQFDVLCVDHCHETGKIRGLLCRQCNLSLGGFKDDLGLLVAAVNWLK